MRTEVGIALQNELKKIFGNDAVFDNTRYVGRTCIGSLAPDILAKAEIVEKRCIDNYDAIRIKIISRHGGEIDTQTISFEDIWGLRPVPDSSYFKDGVSPRIWLCQEEFDWYSYYPTKEDFDVLRNKISEYTEMFRFNNVKYYE